MSLKGSAKTRYMRLYHRRNRRADVRKMNRMWQLAHSWEYRIVKQHDGKFSLLGNDWKIHPGRPNVHGFNSMEEVRQHLEAMSGGYLMSPRGDYVIARLPIVREDDENMWLEHPSQPTSMKERVALAAKIHKNWLQRKRHKARAK